MRTIKLSDNEIETIVQALGIAETAYTEIHKNIVSKLVVVRGNIQATEQLETADSYHKQACKFADLNVELRNGSLWM